MKSRTTLLTTVIFSLVSVPVFACLWDYDTLAMERQRFPNILELISGKFLRHSQAFYEWRIEDRKSRIKDGDSSFEVLDDLAVAYEKTGDHDQAIATALTAMEKDPNRYETHANLGTFYIHAGQMEKGLEHIEKAIKINPDAHFGREKIQKYLVEYVLANRVDGKLKLPIREFAKHQPRGYHPGFAAFVLEKEGVANDYKQHEKVIESAIKGVVGMMRFGNHDSPVLLEAIGDLLYNESTTGDAKRLGARAYLKAAYEAPDEDAKAGYRKLAKECLRMQTVAANSEDVLKLPQLERTFKAELEEAEDWYRGVVEDEKKWIDGGKNPEQEFEKKYYQAPSLYEDVNASRTIPWPWIIGLSIGVVLIGSIFVWQLGRRKG